MFLQLKNATERHVKRLAYLINLNNVLIILFSLIPDCSLSCVDGSRIRDKWPLLFVQFVFNGVLWYRNSCQMLNEAGEPVSSHVRKLLHIYLHNVLDDGSPSWELICARCLHLPLRHSFSSIATLTTNDIFRIECLLLSLYIFYMYKMKSNCFSANACKYIHLYCNTNESVINLQSKNLPQLECYIRGSANCRWCYCLPVYLHAG